MSSVVRFDKSDSTRKVYRLYCKGAAEVVLRLCTRKIHADGSRKRLNSDDHEKMHAFISEMAEKGLRTIALAYRDFKHVRRAIPLRKYKVVISP